MKPDKAKRDKFINKVNISDKFNKAEKEYIKNALYIFTDAVQFLEVKEKLLNKNIYIIKYPIKDAYGMIQPLIDGRPEIYSYRIYINETITLDEAELTTVILHELIHTLTNKDILRHGSILYRRIAKYIERKYFLNVFKLDRRID